MKQFDVIIIGSGLGGLECGYILSKEGYSVCVLEKNRQFGGNLQIYVRDKCIFDTGIHYIGGLSEGQNLHQYFKYLDLIGKLNLKKLDDDAFDKISFDDDPTAYKYAQGFENFKSTLTDYFPTESEGINRYCSSILEIIDHFPLYRIREGDEKSFFSKSLNVGVKPFIDSLTGNIRLRNVLAGNNLLYAGVADKTPLYVHALVLNSYIESAYKIVDGGAQIAKILVDGIRKNGGEVINYQEVMHFGFENDTLTHVETTTGEKYFAKNFISNIHPRQTLRCIDSGFVKKVYRNRINGLENTIGIFILNLVFKKDTFPYLNFNHYHFKRNEVWDILDTPIEKWPESYALFTPANSKSDQFAECLSVMTYVKYDWFKKWEDSINIIPHCQHDRGEDYAAFKALLADKLLTEVEKKFPGIRTQIKSINTSTPLSFRDYLGNGDGALYGVLKDYHDPLKTFISPRTKIPNLFLTGQNLNMHGVLGVTIGAVKTCGEFLGLGYLLKKINEA